LRISSSRRSTFELTQKAHNRIVGRSRAIRIVDTLVNALTRLSYSGPLRLIIHEDSRDAAARGAVDRMAALLSELREWEVHVLRRPHRTGGKPAAVNHAPEQSGHQYEYFLLCDNDSTVLDGAGGSLRHEKPPRDGSTPD
jgi:hypothetical protein